MKPEYCIKNCNGPDCEGCQDFEPKYKKINADTFWFDIFNDRHPYEVKEIMDELF